MLKLEACNRRRTLILFRARDFILFLDQQLLQCATLYSLLKFERFRVATVLVLPFYRFTGVAGFNGQFNVSHSHVQAGFVFAESIQLLVVLSHLRVDGLYVSLVLLAKEFEQLAL